MNTPAQTRPSIFRLMILTSALALPAVGEAQSAFVRGDANDDGAINIADAVFSLQFLFSGGAANCLDAMDADDNGSLDIADPIRILNVIFAGTQTLPGPGPLCGTDSTADALGCSSYTCPVPPRTRPLFPLTISEPGATALESGDVDLDGHVDLVGIDAGDVFVRFGEAGGSFLAPVVIATDAVDAVELRDLEGDGDLDLVSASSANDSVLVLLNDGAGLFSPAMNFSVGSNPSSLAVDDFNGDGLLDVVAACAGDQTVHLLLGAVMGGFSPTTPLLTSGVPSAIQSADFNGDSLPDLAVAIPLSQTIEIFLATSPAVWGASVSIPSGGGTSALIAGDFNDDTAIDLVGANEGAGTFSFLSGVGDGSFAAPASTFFGGEPRELRSGDFDEDGVLDLAMTTSLSRVRVFYGDAVDGLVTGEQGVTPLDPRALAVGDLDDDGHLDAIVGVEGGSALTVLYGRGTGAFAVRSAQTTGFQPGVLHVADVNGDSIPDVYAVGITTARVFLGNGDTTFSFSQLLMAPTFRGSAAADLNDDGFDDLVYGTSSGMGVYYGSSTSIGPPSFVTLGTANTHVAVGDVNNDGVSDAIAIGTGGFVVPSPVSIFLGGAGGLTSAGDGGITVFGNDRSYSLVDLDSDGNLDLVYGSGSGGGTLGVHAGAGDGTFSESPDQVVGTWPVSLEFADVNSDGHLDAVMTAAFYLPRVAWGNGDLTFSNSVTLFTALFDEFAVGDLDLDGDVDVVTTIDGNDRAQVWINDGAGNFTDSGGEFYAGPDRAVVRLADFDGDGDLDCMSLNDSAQVYFYEAFVDP